MIMRKPTLAGEKMYAIEITLYSDSLVLPTLTYDLIITLSAH